MKSFNNTLLKRVLDVGLDVEWQVVTSELDIHSLNKSFRGGFAQADFFADDYLILKDFL